MSWPGPPGCPDEKDGPAKVGASVKLDCEAQAGARYLERLEAKKDARQCAK